MQKQLLTEALTAAESLAAIRLKSFSVSKQQERQPVREAIAMRLKLQQAELTALWEAAETHSAVQQFLADTLRKL